MVFLSHQQVALAGKAFDIMAETGGIGA